MSFDAPKLAIPPEITPKVFLEWRDARRGTQHPVDLSNPFWTWLLSSKESCFHVNEHFKGPSSLDSSPCWSAERYGQSTITLPDGRTVLIGGKHEDHYDPDFFIYNDVAIQQTDGKTQFLGYPAKDFPPTDFHSSTLLADRIIIIGNLGYPEDRDFGKCQILFLDLTTWTVTRQSSTGDSPGWIHDHQAQLSPDQTSIRISGGKVAPDEESPLIENIDEWSLDLENWEWKRITKREWPLLEFSRKDGEFNQLWELRQGLWELKHGKLNLDEALGDEVPEETRQLLKEATQYPLPKNPETLENLYRPEGLPHEPLPEIEDEYRIHRIKIDQVVVRYQEDMSEVLMTIEGKLPEKTIHLLTNDLQHKLEEIENASYQTKTLRP